MSARNRLVVLVVSLLFAASCAGGGTQSTTASSVTRPSTPPDSGGSQATPSVAGEMEIDLVECHQAVFPTVVDPQVADVRLLPGQQLYLDEAGRARFTLIAKDCGDIAVDGTSQGPGHFNTAWVRIEGPEEVRTRPDEPETVVSPTDYFLPVLFETDNDGFASATAGFGVLMTRPGSMTMDPPGSTTRSGSVEDDEREPRLAYRWTISGGNPFGPEAPDVVVHVLEGPDALAAGTLTYDIECDMNGGLIGGEATVDVETPNELEDLVGSGYSLLGGTPEVTCHVVITRQPA